MTTFWIRGRFLCCTFGAPWRFSTHARAHQPVKYTFIYTHIPVFCVFAEEYGRLSVDSQAVFANNEVSLKYIDTYGFDYDYTLACYTSRLPELMYHMCKERLVRASKVCGVRRERTCAVWSGSHCLVCAVVVHLVSVSPPNCSTLKKSYSSSMTQTLRSEAFTLTIRR